MFTGIIEDVGSVAAMTEVENGRRLRIATSLPVSELDEGASIAVDGACLTVVARDAPSGGSGSPHHFEVEAIGTTLSRTVAGRYGEGSRVNLERARSLGERLDGHLVQGHVDGTARVTGVRTEGIHHLLEVALPPEVWRGTILHGSITLNGVSLTVNGLTEPEGCQVALIPFTWEHTNLSSLEVGDPVNVEGDLIGKYVGKYLRAIQLDARPETNASTLDPLRGEST